MTIDIIGKVNFYTKTYENNYCSKSVIRVHNAIHLKLKDIYEKLLIAFFVVCGY